MKNQRGFTLIELMVIVAIIAVLLSIGLPTFLGAKTRAQDRATQADLRSAILTAKVYFASAQTFQDTDLATTAVAYETLEPTLTWVTAITAGPPYSELGVYVADDNDVVLVKQSASGTYFCIHEDVTAPGASVSYGSGAAVADVDEAADCVDPAW